MKKEKIGGRGNEPAGITLAALVITVVVYYVKDRKCSNNNSFLLMNS